MLLVGHVLPVPSATDKDGEDDELVYWLDRSKKLPFELVFFGSNQIGRQSSSVTPSVYFSIFSIERHGTVGS